MKSPTPEAQCAEVVFQIESLIFGVYFSNNISQVKLNNRESELDLTFEISQPLTSRIIPSIILKTV